MYGLILFMGIEMFINEGLFRGIKLIFVDRSLFNEGQQGVVRIELIDDLLKSAPSHYYSIISPILYYIIDFFNKNQLLHNHSNSTSMGSHSVEGINYYRSILPTRSTCSHLCESIYSS